MGTRYAFPQYRARDILAATLVSLALTAVTLWDTTVIFDGGSGIPVPWLHSTRSGPPFLRVDFPSLAFDVAALLCVWLVAAWLLTKRRPRPGSRYAMVTLLTGSILAPLFVVLNVWPHADPTLFTGFPLTWHRQLSYAAPASVTFQQSFQLLILNSAVCILLLIGALVAVEATWRRARRISDATQI